MNQKELEAGQLYRIGAIRFSAEGDDFRINALHLNNLLGVKTSQTDYVEIRYKDHSGNKVYQRVDYDVVDWPWNKDSAFKELGIHIPKNDHIDVEILVLPNRTLEDTNVRYSLDYEQGGENNLGIIDAKAVKANKNFEVEGEYISGEFERK